VARAQQVTRRAGVPAAAAGRGRPAPGAPRPV